MLGLPMSIRCRGRNARISLQTFAAPRRSTARRCGRRNRSGQIRFRRSARLRCLTRKAMTAFGMRRSRRCGRGNAISAIQACWRRAWFAREEILAWLIARYCRKPRHPWPTQQRSLSRTASSGCRLLFTTTKCFSATIGWKCCNGGSAASAIGLTAGQRVSDVSEQVPAHVSGLNHARSMTAVCRALFAN
jgi:hypothetical protein